MIYILYGLLPIIVWFSVSVLYYAFKYKNNYKLLFYFGNKGCGKSTMLCKQAQKHLKKGWFVYSTSYIAGTRLINPKDIGRYNFPPNSLLLIDEMGLLYNNRNYKSFPDEAREFFKLQRHYKVKVICCSQVWDIDKTVRQLCDKLFIMTNFGGFLSIARCIKRKLVVVQADGEHESRIADQLILLPLLLFWMGSREYTWIPKWQGYFDSFDVPERELMPSKYQGYKIDWDRIKKTKKKDWKRSLKLYNELCKRNS